MLFFISLSAQSGNSCIHPRRGYLAVSTYEGQLIQKKRRIW